MLETIKAKVRGIIAYLSDAAHRRMVVALGLFIANRWIGSEVAGIDDITNLIDVMIGLSVAAWAKTPAKKDS